MRLDKTLYVIREQESAVPTGTDPYTGEPIYDIVTTKTPFSASVEPFSNRLAETKYGLFVDVNYRCFTNPDININLADLVEYKGNSYIVSEIMSYDRHWEVLIKNR